ncbi:YdbL family protein [Kiloniella sp. EL199]|uniref:YdbL family protein n=1 Tax=Kiloniella sp. EL199 TaxID=2107581 RepID=UPI000EA2A6FE|nr:YdbL family protein [Kiloniella sp. EL199]
MVFKSMKMLRVLFVAFAFASVIPIAWPTAWAADLDSLRSSGAVGERYDGLAVARDGSASDFVSATNAKRTQIYQERANKEGVSVKQVGMVYAKQIMNKAPSGTWFQAEDGSWVQK